MIPSPETCGKIIALDFSMYIHMGYAVWQKCPGVPAIYTALSSIIGTLNKVGIEPDDIVLILCDSRPSWRCSFSEEYKSNRESLPQEVRDQFDWLKNQLNKLTNWIILEPGHGIEADDLATTICKYFKDIPEIVLCSSDHDWEQAWSLHEGVKIFSLHSHKWKIKPENYNVYNEIAHMIHKETSDNLVTSVMNNEEYDKRLMLVDLTRLPEWVEKTIFDYLSKEELYNKNIQHETVPIGKNSLQPRLDNIYNDHSKFVSYEEQIRKTEKKETRIKEKKIEIKMKAKRMKERETKRTERMQIQFLKVSRKKQNGVKENDKVN